MSDGLTSRRRTIQKRIREINKELVASAGALQETLDEWLALAREDGLLAFLAALANCYSRLVMRTPVDTGRARAGWHIEGEVNEWKPEEGDYKDLVSERIASEVGKLPALSKADIIYVMSNVEYILPLEAGWSKQSSGFWGLFITELEHQLQQAANSLRSKA